ncbi:hypothetical protein [Shewanella sp. 10N.286.52.C2]|uniref:hypothetical protein n=1 Tax=Shewanella sp. 10N.286.52.C2 TaxID=1880838 RepID=UPI001F53CB04|nr:hypothetical protein [Shewanella sp. 10N.286.52.C2]
MKVVEEMGGLVLLGALLAPLMNFVGLPSEMGIVWATTLLTNIYTGIIIFINLDTSLSVAQITILCSMMLLAHGLPIEASIAKKAGVSLWATLVIRIGGSFALAWLQHQFYRYSEQGQEAAVIVWQQESNQDIGYLAWFVGQLENLAMTFVVIAALMFVLKILKLTGFERLLIMLLQPLFKLIGIGKEAANLAIIGITLGLSLGGGLLINGAKKGTISRYEIFITIMMLNLLHSVIEDTLLIMLLGADFNMVFWGRIIFTFIVIITLSMVIRRYSHWNRANLARLNKTTE